MQAGAYNLCGLSCVTLSVRVVGGFVLSIMFFAFTGCSTFGTSKPESSARIALYYIVRPGDTIQKISKKYRIPTQTILSYNHAIDPDSLKPGTKLLMGYRYSGQPNLKAGTNNLIPVSIRGQQKVYKRPNGDLGWPVEGGRIVSSFGPRDGSFHDGLDIADSIGTPIFAAHHGQVVYSGDSISGYGNLLILKHPTGLLTVYAHNDKLKVRKGEKVIRGQHIATLGSTGHVTGPHLHFEVRIKDSRGRYVAVDPMPLLFREGGKPPRFRVNESLTPILASFLK